MCSFLLTKEYHPLFKGMNNILHPFQGNLHKGMLHCPQGMPWSLKVQLLIQEYPFKITSFQRNEQIYCILFKETCIKACCTVLKEYHGPLKCNCLSRIPFPNNAILSARNTILLHMTCPCIALSYGNITLFQRDCCICERVPFGTRP